MAIKGAGGGLTWLAGIAQRRLAPSLGVHSGSVGTRRLRVEVEAEDRLLRRGQEPAFQNQQGPQTSAEQQQCAASIRNRAGTTAIGRDVALVRITVGVGGVGGQRDREERGEQQG